jgi:hypothetical protein
MEGDRKYKQHGYQNSGRGFSNSEHSGQGDSRGDERSRPQGPRPPIDITGPRLPRLVQVVTGSRCFNCSTMLPADTDFRGNCPKCNTALHCCKQCAHFEPSTRFQCLKPIPVRIPGKDLANECELFKPRLTVARDSAQASQHSPVPPANVPVPRSASDARAAFDKLFSKPTEP